MKPHIEILARGVCVKDGKILLCHSRRTRHTYLPGGHVEFREGARASLVREVAEELGLASEAGRFLGAAEHTFRQRGERHCEINLVFELTIPGLAAARPPPSEEAYLDFRWVRIDALRRSTLEPFVLRRQLAAWLDPASRAERWSTTYKEKCGARNAERGIADAERD